jgi:FAD/FMN-containing dehydrogenase/Fe-S oxidoreductase
MNDFFADLEKHSSADIRTDLVSRMLYATDASIYRMEPLGVVIPRTADDVAATVELAAQYGVPVLPRGAGSSLAGQAVGRAVVLDLSRHLDAILEIDAEARTVRTQAGVVLDRLNAALRPHGLMIGPDPASGNRAVVGGAIGNNATGAHSILYGHLSEHIESLRVVLADGSLATFRPLEQDEVARLAQRESLEGTIYRRVRQIVDANRAEIAARFPRHWRRSSGYNLDRLADGKPLNLSPLIAGSEGTLATVVEATLRLVPRPKMTALAIVHFDDLIEAMEATPIILEREPSAVELMDRMLLDLTRDVPDFARRLTFVRGEPEALLAVEFYGETEPELNDRLDRLEAHLMRHGVGRDIVRALTPEAQTDFWGVRKAGLGLLMSRKGDWKPIPFIEDCSVPVDHLAEYVAAIRQAIAEQGTQAAFYAHASAGCLHVRPLINLKKPEEVARMFAISEAASDLVRRFGGAMSGEHGDGLSRSQWNEKLFGPRIYEAFRQVKAAFDPQGIMNPGKIVDAPPMTENLRYAPPYRPVTFPTRLDFSAEGDFVRAVELCNGCGTCLKQDVGTMCPSFMALREEMHCTRGRANLLRAALGGLLPPEALDGPELYAALELCLACKGCRAECPSQVDMAALKAEYLARYQDRHGLSWRARLIGHIALVNRLGCALAPVSNWVAGSALSRWALEKLVGFDRRRPLPPFARPTFTQWFQRRPRPVGALSRRVVLFHDTYMTYNYPSVGVSAVRLLEAAGFEVILPEKKCCGRPMISQGMLDEARRLAEYNIARLAPYVEEGLAIVGCEPSCVAALKEEYPLLVPGPAARKVAEATFLLEDFLIDPRWVAREALSFRQENRPVLFHGHCHQKALSGTEATSELLSRVPGLGVQVLDAGCCGMAGAFGYEKEHFDLSVQIAELRLLPAVRNAPPEAAIVVTGASCRQQIEQGTGRRVLHVAEVLAEALPG